MRPCHAAAPARLAALLVVMISAPTLAQEPIDLTPWTVEGPPANGSWTVSPDGTSVLQTINGDPTFFVSPEEVFNREITGTLRVETTSDDDYVGFVFGYQSPLTENEDGVNDFRFYLLDWKQATQNFAGVIAQEGFALMRVDGTITNYLPGFWGHADHEGFEVLATSFGPGRGWADLTTYTFTLLYTPARIAISVDGGVFEEEVIFDLSAADAGVSAFPAGRFGFYNYSQEQVRYAGFTSTTAAEPAPASGALAIGRPFPNPAGAAQSVRLRVYLAEAARARVAVYDVLGREVAVLADAPLAAGWTDLAWSDRAAPGLYVVRVEAGSESRAVRVTRLP